MGILDGMAVLATGGGKGLSHAVIARYVREGANVGVLERVPEQLDELVAEFGDSILPIKGDVRSVDDNERAVQLTVERYGRLDTFVAMAATTDFSPSLSNIPIKELPKAFEDIMGVNTLGPALGALAARDALRESEGSVIFVLSTSAFFPGGQGAIYNLSKSALLMLVRTLAYEFAPYVRVNGVVPGPIADSSLRGTGSLAQEAIVVGDSLSANEDAVRQMVPLQIVTKGDDYAGLFVLLASKEARAATGSIIHWDSGIGIVGHGARGLGAAWNL